jgi:hypothetical protein
MIDKDFSQRCNEWLIEVFEELLPEYTKKQDWDMVQKISQALQQVKNKQNSQLINFHSSSNVKNTLDGDQLNLMEVN